AQPNLRKRLSTPENLLVQRHETQRQQRQCPPDAALGLAGLGANLPRGTPMIDCLLIANRGEIACRVMRTTRALGIRSVAVHSAVDADARHVREADLAVNLGGSTAAGSYLLGERIIAAARASGAQAIHPGYG